MRHKVSSRGIGWTLIRWCLGMAVLTGVVFGVAYLLTAPAWTLLLAFPIWGLTALVSTSKFSRRSAVLANSISKRPNGNRTKARSLQDRF